MYILEGLLFLVFTIISAIVELIMFIVSVLLTIGVFVLFTPIGWLILLAIILGGK